MTEPNKPMTLGIKEVTDEMILLIAEENTEAFKQLYYATQYALYGYILSYLKNIQDTEDIMQDTYLQIRAKAHMYRPEGKPLAWIFTIAKNLSLMRIRSGNNKGTVDIDSPNCLGLAGTDGVSEDRVALQTALAVLDEESRNIVVFHAVTGLKHREIADILNLSISTVLSKYNRGLKKLKKHLEGDN